MRGHYFLKWLFLTVLSVSVLHFREASPAGHFRTEQVSVSQNASGAKVLNLKDFRPSGNLSTHLAHFKYTQHIRLSYLSIKLSDAVIRRPELSVNHTPSRHQTQNQHFRSRTIPSDDSPVFQS